MSNKLSANPKKTKGRLYIEYNESHKYMHYCV